MKVIHWLEREYCQSILALMRLTMPKYVYSIDQVIKAIMQTERN